ncbi:MAG: membrane integrity-associated transporter subunit PqiC [Gammaproteobacteria bacterium]|nr:membrane integrity-associated transporter subunit PqiC [Gammaproteobacteria bacterium]
MPIRARGFASIALLALSACSLAPPHAQSPQYHDFGPPVAARAQTGASVGLREVTAPAWLDSGAIHYRLLADDPTRLRAYARQRWIAPPAELLAQNLREQLPAEGRPRYWLQLRLARFEQDFDGTAQSHAVIEVQALLLDADGAVRASRNFRFSAESPPNVDGAIAGLSALANQASQAIAAWSVKPLTADAGPPS